MRRVPDWIVFALLGLNLAGVLWLVLRPRHRPADPLLALERLERELRDEMGRLGQGLRADMGTFQQVLLTQSGDVARTQNEQIDSFRSQLGVVQLQTEAALRRF